MNTVLRWIATPFAAVLGSILAYALVSLWIGFNNVGYEVYSGAQTMSITQIVLGIAAQAAAGAALVYCGAIVAPSHKKSCSIVFATLVCVMSVISIVLHNVMYEFSFLQLIHCIATAAGAIGVACNIEDIMNN